MSKKNQEATTPFRIPRIIQVFVGVSSIMVMPSPFLAVPACLCHTSTVVAKAFKLAVDVGRIFSKHRALIQTTILSHADAPHLQYVPPLPDMPRRSAIQQQLFVLTRILLHMYVPSLPRCSTAVLRL